MITSRSRIVDELSAYPFDVEKFSEIPIDVAFFCPSLSWLQNEFGSWCLDRQMPYKKESRDCDNIALRTLVDAQEAWNENKESDAEVADCAVFLVDLKIVPSSVYFSTGFEFDFNGHETLLVRCNNNEYYIFERNQGKAISLRELIAEFVIDRILFVRV